MTTATILKTINALPIAERMIIIEKVIRTIRLEKPDSANPDSANPAGADPNSPSPSGDPWFDDPRNIAIVKDAIQSANEDKEKNVVLKTKEDIKNYFANL